MAEGVTWTLEAKADLRSITTYLRRHHGHEFAESVGRTYVKTMEQLADHPTAGILTDAKLGVMRRKLDRHNYALYRIEKQGILVLNIQSYHQNKKGFR